MALAVLVWGLSAQASAQDGSYVLHREIFKVPLSSINFSPDGSFLLAGFTDGSFRIMDPETYLPSLEVTGAHYKAVHAMDMTPDMEILLSAGHSSIKLWDRTGNHLHDWNGHATTVWNAELSPDGRWAVSSAMNKTFLLWDVEKNQISEHMRGHEDICMCACFDPFSRLIASGSNDLTINIWDLESRQVIATLQGPTGDIYDLAFSPDGHLLAVCSKDHSVRLYEWETAAMRHLLKGHNGTVMEAAFSPDGKYLVTGSADQSVILWDVSSGDNIYQFVEHGGAVTDLVFHPDGLSFFSISTAGDLTRWSVHPELFVLRYYGEDYLNELSADPVFQSRRKGESRKDFQTRQAEAAGKKAGIIDRYYQKYLSGKSP
jgi:WD40 repeat protein